MKSGAHRGRILKAALEASRSFRSQEEVVSVRTHVGDRAGMAPKIL
jgi:hypothetical protein